MQKLTYRPLVLLFALQLLAQALFVAQGMTMEDAGALAAVVFFGMPFCSAPVRQFYRLAFAPLRLRYRPS